MSPAGEGPRLVVLRALGLGDLLTAVPALRALRERFPGHRPLLAVPAPLAPLARLATGFEVADAAPLAPLPGELHGAAVAVNLHGRGPQSHRVLLAARPRRMLWFANPEVPQSAEGPPWREEEHEVLRWCRLLAHYGIPADPRRLEIPAPDLPVPPEAHGATLIHPGAASPARRWPPERWAVIARAEREANRRVVITGGPGEEELGHRVAALAGLPAGSVYAGRTDLLQLAALVAVAGRVACGDTGIAHLATALSTPSVVLFGPTSPSRWGPPPDRRHHRALWAGTTGDPHGRTPDPGLLRIGSAEVLRALDALPEKLHRGCTLGSKSARTTRRPVTPPPSGG
ncbi:hypothetical protein Rxycam_02741 [Rubrobacter xylanophilus DSM 9941]|uniref:glycosyltransferase family 9 protein n=1 Tax=Rubrobacter xylanophilus TaxID=49319 RepID=UPI001C644043|nr:glycosyltransferase family 9 protein [Rubrobacter xylanophilus]QYJ16905.1 hypothetical protein Rxycam_02741 [Rubrobacter xylanophilus DSM 9941]